MFRAFTTALLLAGLLWLAPASAQRKQEPQAVPAQPPGNAAPQQLYKYKTKSGRIAYTNILDEVPLDQRTKHEVDLSHVTLNTDVGNDLNQQKQLAVEHEQLAASPYCKQLEQVAAKTELEQLWDDHPVTIVCGALVALLILMTPTMMRKVHPPEWARVLTKVIPALLVVGGTMYGMQTANKKIVESRKRVKPCLSETFDGLDQSKDPAAERVNLIEELKREIARAHDMGAERDALLEQIEKER
jgi:hypothetical protein